MSSSTSWISAGIKVLEKIQESQADSIERACRICAEAIGSGGLGFEWKRCFRATARIRAFTRSSSCR